jgi:hypothetical protein
MTDRLTRMASALRQAKSGRHSDPRRSRGDILLAFERRKRSRHLAVRGVTLLVASFLLSTAWAASDSARRAAFREAVQHWLESSPTARLLSRSAAVPARAPSSPPTARAPTAETPAEPPAGEPESSPSAERALVAPPLVAVTPPTPAATSSDHGARHIRPVRATPRSAASEDAPAAAALPQEDEDNRLFELANRTHFRTQDPARALSLWNAYLEAMPEGRFVAEAQFNRALCLVRLGRVADARTALAPFARGTFGAYRQTEARRLLSLLDAPP